MIELETSVAAPRGVEDPEIPVQVSTHESVVGGELGRGSAGRATAVPDKRILVEFDADGQVVAVRKEGGATTNGIGDPPAEEFARCCSAQEVAGLCVKLDSFLIGLRPAEERPNSFPSYFEKWAGVGRAPLFEGFFAPVLVWSSVGSFAGILLLCVFHYSVFLQFTDDLSGVVGSFGAQAVLLYAAPGVALVSSAGTI